MIKRLAVAFGLSLCGVAALAQVGTMPGWPPHQPTSGGSPPAFVGFGDVQAAAVYVSATFAYSSADRGTAAAELCNGGVCADVNSDASTGIVPNTPTINGAPCNNSTHICTIRTLYDKGTVGSDYQQIIEANRPVFVVDGYTTNIPCASYTAASARQIYTTSGGGSTGAHIISAVLNRPTDVGTTVVFSSNAVQLQISSGAPVKAVIYAGGAGTLGVNYTDGTWAAANGIINGASSYLNVNGVTASGVNIGTTGFTGSQYVGAYNGSGYYFNGKICEAGWVNNTGTTSVADNLTSNQRTRYGF